MKEKITIYTNENCPYCKTIKDKLNKIRDKKRYQNGSKIL